ncbi:hydantoinase B/oxoprolinase family protein [Methylopila sp. Yamaguchi]|uniref:hydantoinase B/oxoprolinase family protein n=1 Tax=Methylopila sp. Yamaguchi TaxID=1437817 RepID=UPI000CAFB121|nr:hydantoinase B/oxoprolinase family protein [Methylopila sp. Yamaguchi]GBD49872.1 5-oxoprolinase [Methylopila sp. Yamaguchi]
MITIDPVRRELLKNALVTTADNALVMVMRTARTSNVKNSMDFSAAVCDGRGRLVAQGVAVPVHLGVVMPALEACLAHFGDDVREGDVLASNDPYSGCSHLNDIFTFKPVFVDGQRVAFVSLILHHSDLGGRVPGGNAADSMEIFEEGLRIPPLKIVEGGAINQTLMRIIEFNTRVPDRVMGDVRAQLAALDQSAAEVEKLARSWRPDVLAAYLDDLIDYAEKLTRSELAQLPDGVVEFEEWNDDDGVGNGPIRIHLKLTKSGDTIEADFSGTDDDLGGAVHCNRAFTVSCAYAAIRTVLSAGIPNNAGLYRPITVKTRPGTFVDVSFPAAVGSRGQVGFRLRSIVLGALATLLPGRLPACAGGSEFAIAASGRGSDGRRFLHLEFHNNTGLGANPDSDGQDAGPYCIGNLANVPVELIEAETPIVVDEYGFLPDTGGPGRFRGALGLVRQYRFLTDDVQVQVRADRFKSRPWGLFGGGPGSSASNTLNPGTERQAALPSKFTRRFNAGDVLRVEMAGAGGYGAPSERDPEAVRLDLLRGKISPAHAREVYGRED